MEGWTNLYTVHDVIPLTQPELSPIDPKRHRRLLDRIVASSDLLITVSEAARNEIVQSLGCRPEQVRNCSQPVNVGATTEPPPMDLQAGQYLLVCGSVEPRKNIVRLVEAYEQSGVDMPLVVAGPDGWHAEEIGARLKESKGVLRLHYCDRQQMLSLIAHARGLLMPSLAEGFGLPVVEAMASGTAVLTSNSGALAETAGGAALSVDPKDVRAIAASIRRLCLDDALQAQLIRAGRERALSFTGDQFSNNLARVYSELIAPSAT
jgi:glycosyltransferase involved in cell wall biosynthesis